MSNDNSASAASNFASACQSLLAALPADQRAGVARAVVVVVGTDGTKAVFEVDNEEPTDAIASSVRDLLVFGGLTEYAATLRKKLIEKLT